MGVTVSAVQCSYTFVGHVTHCVMADVHEQCDQLSTRPVEYFHIPSSDTITVPPNLNMVTTPQSNWVV